MRLSGCVSDLKRFQFGLSGGDLGCESGFNSGFRGILCKLLRSGSSTFVCIHFCELLACKSRVKGFVGGFNNRLVRIARR